MILTKGYIILQHFIVIFDTSHLAVDIVDFFMIWSLIVVSILSSYLSAQMANIFNQRQTLLPLLLSVSNCLQPLVCKEEKGITE
jgi:hypothetical protein